MMLNMKKVFLIILIQLVIVSCRIHKLSLTDDQRPYVDLTTFGFLKGGVLEVQVINFKLPSGSYIGDYGFTIDRTVNDAISPYPEAMDGCILAESENSIISQQHPAIIFLKMDFKNKILNTTCMGEVETIALYPNKNMEDYKETVADGSKIKQCAKSLPITMYSADGYDYYNTSFAMFVLTESVQGLYNVYFHNCPRALKVPFAPSVNMLLQIFEINKNNYLSAGEIPLPTLYTVTSLIFLYCAALWTYMLKTSKHPVFKIHIIMCVLVYLKALSLAFHGINYHFIQTKGEHVTAWAILYYITHLLKGAVLFVTIVLVGTGWNFIKHILADRDKKLFMIVIPLQVVANVAEIILAESEEGAVEHNAWRSTLWIVDLMCCGAILFPVVWSIRHLQDASTTDGKAAINLRKLKLFRHFYIMVVSYIYFTRIIICLLKVIVAFQYSWIDELFREMATLMFFVTTGYKFRPAAANPYFTPNHIEDDEAQVLSKIGVLEGVSKIPKRGDQQKDDMQPLIQDTNYDSS